MAKGNIDQKIISLSNQGHRITSSLHHNQILVMGNAENIMVKIEGMKGKGVGFKEDGIKEILTTRGEATVVEEAEIIRNVRMHLIYS